ncbi:MAG: hypothetical protein HYS21_05950 [Deltaproteobacteria bacterium]|nr:hypothetical protein [Deltaproteobacteria bacterium]
MKIRKDIVKCLGLAIFFGIVFRVAFRTPLEDLMYMTEAGVLVVFYGYLFLYLLGKLMKPKRFSSIEIFLLSLMVFPLLVGYSASKEYHQPLIYGFLAERAFYLNLSGLVLLSMLRKNTVTLAMVEKSFIILSWALLAAYMLVWLAVDPQKYADSSLVVFSPEKGGYLFLFNVIFLIFPTIYYAIRYFHTKKTAYILYAALFLSYLAFIRQDRTIIVSLLMGVAVFFLRNFSLKLLLKYTAYATFIVVIITSGIYLAKPDFLSRYFATFSNAFLTVAGKATKEDATNIRLIETAIAAKQIIKNPYFGNGDLSRRWRNGFERLYGYFYPSDIGLIGVVFIFGVIGTLALNFQFLFAYYYVRKADALNYDAFFQSCKYFLVALFFDSLSAGHIVFFSAISIIFIVILYYYYELLEKERHSIAVGAAQA